LDHPVTPPQNLTGQVWADIKGSAAGYYVFAANVKPENEEASIEFCIDDLSLGERQISPTGYGWTQYFVLDLAAAPFHRFIIKQVSGAFTFWNLTAWSVLVSQQ
jgi:hypothetical protein